MIPSCINYLQGMRHPGPGFSSGPVCHPESSRGVSFPPAGLLLLKKTAKRAILGPLFPVLPYVNRHFARVEPKLHAGEAFGLNEFEVGVRVLAEDAEAGFPVGVTALGLGSGRRGDGRQKSASCKGHNRSEE